MLLRAAVRLALLLTDDQLGGWRIAGRLRELRAELEPGPHYREPGLPVILPPPPEPGPPVRASRRHGNRRILRGFRSSEMREIVSAAIDQGFTCERTGSGHIRCVSPSGSSFVLSHTAAAGEARALLNARAQARRAGLEI